MGLVMGLAGVAMLRELTLPQTRVSEDVGSGTAIGWMARGVIEGHGGSAMVDLPKAVDGGPSGTIVASARSESELVDGVGQSSFLWVIGRDPGLDDVEAAQAFLDGPLPPGAVHALAGVVHVDAVVHHELNLAVDADLVRMLQRMLVERTGEWHGAAYPEKGKKPVEVFPPGVDIAVRLPEKDSAGIVSIPASGPSSETHV